MWLFEVVEFALVSVVVIELAMSDYFKHGGTVGTC